jgi:hypothetical protein
VNLILMPHSESLPACALAKGRQLPRRPEVLTRTCHSGKRRCACPAEELRCKTLSGMRSRQRPSAACGMSLRVVLIQMTAEAHVESGHMIYAPYKAIHPFPVFVDVTRVLSRFRMGAVGSRLKLDAARNVEQCPCKDAHAHTPISAHGYPSSSDLYSHTGKCHKNQV